jgi:hypothetical protein
LQEKSYSGASLVAAVNEQIEESLWTSIRALEEGQLLLCRVLLPGAPIGERRPFHHRFAAAICRCIHT